MLRNSGVCMKKTVTIIILSLLLTASIGQGATALDIDPDGGAEKPKTTQGSIISLWPMFDYRSSPATGYSNLSILGPLFKREHSSGNVTTAIRPLFFSIDSQDSNERDILYPLASTSNTEDSSDSQVLKLYQSHLSHAGTPDEKQEKMLFPFYISGKSEKFGPYTSFFPFYGNIYERFWRDEYHFTLFPLYGRTVKKGTTSNNYLYPLFNTVSGENESGFGFWPLYGQSAKADVYRKRFILWPLYFSEELDQNSENHTENFYLLPFYASSTSPKRNAIHILWPLFGVVRDGSGTVIERDFGWPFWMTASNKEYSIKRYLPFYAESRTKDNYSHFIMWPLYRHETIESTEFRLEKTSMLYFLFSNSEESWPQTEKKRAKNTFWPLYAWKKNEDGIRTISMPALIEPILWSEGVERNWAPLWRLFIARWDDKGNSAISVLWNLYWLERRGTESIWELSPLFSYRSTQQGGEFRLLKGLFGYATENGKSTLTFLWIPFTGRAM